jgi:hypothetical protein
MDPKQQEAFEEAVERKKDESEARSRAQRPRGGPAPDDPAGVSEGAQSSVVEDGRTQDTFSVRDKNTGKGKKTADKWNQ